MDSKQHVAGTAHLCLVQDEARVVIDGLLLVYNAIQYREANSCV